MKNSYYLCTVKLKQNNTDMAKLEYEDFLKQKENLAEIQRPKTKNIGSGNFSIRESEMKRGVDFYYDWQNQYGIIPYDVVKKHAVAHTAPGKKLGDYTIYYLINKTWLNTYLFDK